MTDSPSIDTFKREAKRLREALGAETPLTHSQSLEAVARQHGHRDWNTACAAAGNRPRPAPISLHQTVTGQYLGRPFRAKVTSLSSRGDGRTRIRLDLENPVDVVEFESFSAFRSRLYANIRPSGETVERTSNGQPQLRLDL